MQENPPEFLRMLAEDIENGDTPNYARATLVVHREDGGWSLWTFGPSLKGDLDALGLLEMGKVILTDRMLAE